MQLISSFRHEKAVEDHRSPRRCATSYALPLANIYLSYTRFLRKFLLIACFFILLHAACSPRKEQVVLYTSQDMIHAEKILLQFSLETGIRVKTVFDNEAVKTVGLANRLLAEKGRPQCDIFWSNEEFRARQLAKAGVLNPGSLRFVGFRSRCLVINTNLIPPSQSPTNLHQLVDPKWKNKIALAYPLFGTTSAHFLALRQRWGAAAWNKWCQDLQQNHPLLVDGNSVVVRMVARGEAWIGLTDSDDVAAGKREGNPIEGIVLRVDGLLIPNTIGLVAGGPHPGSAAILAAYLERPDVLDVLVSNHALQGTVVPATEYPPLEWEAMFASLETSTDFLKKIFLR